MNLSHINFNHITNVKLDPKSINEEDYPDYENAKIKSAVYQGQKLTKEQLKEINTHHQSFILESVFKQNMYA